MQFLYLSENKLDFCISTIYNMYVINIYYSVILYHNKQNSYHIQKAFSNHSEIHALFKMLHFHKTEIYILLFTENISTTFTFQLLHTFYLYVRAYKYIFWKILSAWRGASVNRTQIQRLHRLDKFSWKQIFFNFSFLYHQSGILWSGSEPSFFLTTNFKVVKLWNVSIFRTKASWPYDRSTDFQNDRAWIAKKTKPSCYM